jgi:hypothetical protein
MRSIFIASTLLLATVLSADVPVQRPGCPLVPPDQCTLSYNQPAHYVPMQAVWATLYGLVIVWL